MRFVLTLIMFGSFAYVLNLLFHPELTLDEKFRDLLNIIIGSFLVSFGKVIDFWFKKDDDDDRPDEYDNIKNKDSIEEVAILDFPTKIKQDTESEED